MTRKERQIDYGVSRLRHSGMWRHVFRFPLVFTHTTRMALLQKSS